MLTNRSTSTSAACEDCIPGKYSQTNDAVVTDCTDCDAGKYNADTRRTTQCTDLCAQGRYGSNVGMSDSNQCTRCGANTFSIATGATSISTCQPCPGGEIAPEGSSSCSLCADGTYGATCSQCDEGHYCNGGGRIACPSGKYNSNTGSSEASDCRNCARGKYGLVEGLKKASDCTECSVGTASDDLGRSTVCDNWCVGV